MPTHTRLLIIGSGPAAHSAAIYASRADLHPLLYEGLLANGVAAGGQLTTTTDVENYLGFPTGISGPELMERSRAQSERFGTKIISETIERVDLSNRPFKAWPEDAEEPVTADAVIIATGASARRLGLKGEEKYWQNGVSACAVCDGAVPIFRGKPLVVVGGGDSAAEEAMFLTKYGSSVTVLVRRGALRASKTMARRLVGNEKVAVRYHTVATEVVGEEGPRGLMTGLRVRDVRSGEEEVLQASGLFYAVGHEPATGMFRGAVEMDEEGYIVTRPGTSYTSVEGVFAAGDVQDKRYRQAATSVGKFFCWSRDCAAFQLPFPSPPQDPGRTISGQALTLTSTPPGTGCIAALEAEKFLAEQDDNDVANGIEGEKQAKKPQQNGDAPEYRSNPLL